MPDMPDLSGEPIDEDTKPDVWFGPADTAASPRLIEAFMRGEVTVGGLAEAGWHCIGKLHG